MKSTLKSDHFSLPSNYLLGFSQGGTLHSPTAFAAGLPDDAPIVLVFGAMATGSIDIKDHPYVSKL